MKYEKGMRVLEQHVSVVIKGAMQHAAELLLSNGSIHNKLNKITCRTNIKAQSTTITPSLTL
jgi:hypothetical protein